MTDKQFKECTDNYIHMLVHDASYSERKQREQLSTLTGLTGERLDTLYKEQARQFISLYLKVINSQSFKAMIVEKINTGGGVQLTAIYDCDKVLVVGNGYITVWHKLDDFMRTLDGEMIEPLAQYDY